MKTLLFGLSVFTLTGCQDYFFLSGSKDTGMTKSENAIVSDTSAQPIVQTLAVNLSQTLAEKSVTPDAITKIVAGATLAASSSETAVQASQDFLGGAVGTLSVINSSQLALTEDGTDSVLDIAAAIMDSSYTTTGSYLAEHGNTGSDDTSVDSSVIDKAMQGMAGESIKKLTSVIPVDRLKDAVKTVMNSTSRNANEMHNKESLSVDESNEAFKNVMEGIFSEAKNVEGLEIEDVADAVVATLATVIVAENIDTSKSGDLIIGISKAIINTVASDTALSAKASSIALQVIDTGIKSLDVAGVASTKLSSSIGTFVEAVTTAALSTSVASKDSTLVTKIAQTTQTAAAVVADKKGLDVSTISASASEATKRAVFTVNVSATTEQKEALSSQINKGEEDGLKASNVVSSSQISSIVSSNQAQTQTIINKVVTSNTGTSSAPAPVPTPVPSPSTTVTNPPTTTGPVMPNLANLVFFVGRSSDFTGSSYYNNAGVLYRTDGTTAGTIPLQKEDGTGGVAQLLLFGKTNDQNRDMYPDNKVGYTSNGFFFAGTDATHGSELWVSKGTADTTKMVRDISPGTMNTYFEYPTIDNNFVYFITYNGSYRSAWRSDGNAQNTFEIKDLDDNLVPNPGRLLSCGGYVYLTSEMGSDFYIWRVGSNGTAESIIANESQMSNFFKTPNHQHGVISISSMLCANNLVYLTANEDTTTGRISTLWTFGTSLNEFGAPTTSMLNWVDMDTFGPLSIDKVWYTFGKTFIRANRYYYSGYYSSLQNLIYTVANGTSAAQFIRSYTEDSGSLFNDFPSPDYLVSNGASLYFLSITLNSSYVQKIIRSNGNGTFTQLTYFDGSDIMALAGVDNKIFASVRNNSCHQTPEPWFVEAANSSVSATLLTPSYGCGGSYSGYDSNQFIKTNNALYFSAYNPASDMIELWILDNTTGIGRPVVPNEVTKRIRFQGRGSTY